MSFRNKRFTNVAAMGAVSGGGGGPFSLALQSSHGVASSFGTDSIDFGTLTFAPGATRTLVAIQWVSGVTTTVSSVTIGGVALAQVPRAAIVSGAGEAGADLWESTTPLSGTSGDVVVTWSGTIDFGAAVALYNLTTTTPAVSAVDAVAAGSGSSASLTIAIPSGGAAIVQANTNDGQAITFTNAILDINVGNFWFAHTTATGSVPVTSNYSGDNGSVLSVAAWGP